MDDRHRRSGSARRVITERLLDRHIEPLGAVLREEDRLEVYLASGQTPDYLLRKIVDSAQPKSLFALLCGGDIVGAFGVVEVDGTHNIGAPWFLASEELVTDHWRQLVRETPYWARQLGAGFQDLQNFAWRGNTVHMRWLQRIGADFIDDIPNFGFADKAFVRFSLKKYCHHPSQASPTKLAASHRIESNRLVGNAIRRTHE